MQERPVIVIGHKNPDTDSICSAIAYARLKEIVTDKPHQPRAAGHINGETRYVLQRFGVEGSRYLDTAAPLLRGLELQCE